MSAPDGGAPARAADDRRGRAHRNPRSSSATSRRTTADGLGHRSTGEDPPACYAHHLLSRAAGPEQAALAELASGVRTGHRDEVEFWAPILDSRGCRRTRCRMFTCARTGGCGAHHEQKRTGASCGRPPLHRPGPQPSEVDGGDIASKKRNNHRERNRCPTMVTRGQRELDRPRTRMTPPEEPAADAARTKDGAICVGRGQRLGPQTDSRKAGYIRRPPRGSGPSLCIHDKGRPVSGTGVWIPLKVFDGGSPVRRCHSRCPQR